jgi:hypothetical protein
MDKIFSTIKKRIILYLDNKSISKENFFETSGISASNFKGKGAESELGGDKIVKILTIYPDISPEWLLTGVGSMLRTDVASEPIHKYNVYDASKEKTAVSTNKKIPLYDDVVSIGGISTAVANVDDSAYPSEYIDTGDWFPEATAAIRHYGESMLEYPEGCILAVKEVVERHLIIWGRDYVIETNEYRITKRVQRGVENGCIRAYSSNPATHPDGTLIHEPLDIAFADIRRVFLVLGMVIKKTGGSILYSHPKNNIS